MNWTARILTAVYRRLLRLYPPSFRENFAGEMIWVFTMALETAEHESPISLAGMLFREFAEMPAAILLEHFHERRKQAMQIFSLGMRQDINLVRWSARFLSLLPVGFFLLIILFNDDVRADLSPAIIVQGLLSLTALGAWRWEQEGGSMLMVGAPFLMALYVLSGLRFELSLAPTLIVSGAVALPYLIVGWLYYSVGRHSQIALTARSVEPEQSGRFRLRLGILVFVTLGLAMVILYVISLATPTNETVQSAVPPYCDEPEEMIRSFPAAEPGTQNLPESLKGYELYSYEADDDWYFTFMVGLNRIRTDEDLPYAIEGTSYSISGIRDLESTLKLLPEGEVVTWCGFERPEADVVAGIQTLSEKLGLELFIP